MNLKKHSVQLQPVIFFIFGGTGDLTSRKLVPALYHLFLDGWMPDQFAIVGMGRTQQTDDQFRNTLLKHINKTKKSGTVKTETWEAFLSHVYFQVSDIHEDTTYLEQAKRIKKMEAEWKAKPCIIYYLAVAPRFFIPIADYLAKHKLAFDPEKTRVVIEKPFGRDLESSRVLNNLLGKLFSEKQIYRIDHYLGKETVQNILAFRFANSILEPLWNRNYIDHVQISVTEHNGAGDRGGYYDEAGALRDMVQNHIFQLLCLIAMEPPVSFQADEVRNRKVDVLLAIRKLTSEMLQRNVVRGQYGKGWVAGEEVFGYREETGVHPQSNTETFAAVKLFIDNWRWHGVPFYLRTGKRMTRSSSMISIQFKDVPHMIFPEEGRDGWQQNRLLISIQPEMSIRLQLQVKRPGLDMTLNPIELIFDYSGAYQGKAPEAYETLLLDVMQGDQSLFMRGDQVEAAWEVLMPILNVWEGRKSSDFPNYAAGSLGPEAAEKLIANDGFHWFTLPVNKKE